MYQRVSKSRFQICDGIHNYGTIYTYHAEFKFEHVQMFMILYRRGFLAHAKAFLIRSAFLQPTCGRLSSLPTYEGLSFFAPRLVNGKTWVRAQSWIFNPIGQGAIMPLRHETTVHAHLDGSLDSPYQRTAYFMVFRYKVGHLAAKQDSCKDCCNLIRCVYCPTKVYVEAKRLNNSQDSVLIITKWQLVACGMSPIEKHSEPNLNDSPSRLWRYLRDDAPGSIQASYEEQPGIRYESLLKLAEAWKVFNETS